MRTSDFQYHLPQELIAQRPLGQRAASRLLHLCGDELFDRQFTELPALFSPGDLLVFNNTKVIPARLFGRKNSGGKVEVLVERVLGQHRVLAHVRASKSPKAGTKLHLEDAFDCEVLRREGDLFELYFESHESALDLLKAHGHVPLPPYITRGDEQIDQERYQTVYAERPGSVAAPTAGLHFDGDLLLQLEQAGIKSAFVTLHVGAGTFQPVRCRKIEDHVMHPEYVEVEADVVDKVRAAHARGSRVVAVGTTSIRSLEAASEEGEIHPFQGDTRLFIYPGYRFRTVNAAITNFHLPESTLLMLVCALGGYQQVMDAYRHAVAQRYRFFSYGDAMLVEMNPGAG